MEKIIVGLIGVAAIYFIARKMWREAKGEEKCACSQGSCNSADKHKKEGCGK